MRGIYTELTATILPRTYKSDYTVFIKAKGHLCNFTCFRNKTEFETFKKFMGEYKLINNYGRIIYQFKKNVEEISFWQLDQIPRTAKEVVMLVNGSKVVSFYQVEEDTIKIYTPNPNCLFYKTHKLDYFNNLCFETDTDNFIFDYKDLVKDLEIYHSMHNFLRD